MLANGMRFLVVPRTGHTMVAAGWVAETGSAADPATASGRAHLIEHLLFKGTRTIGVRDAEREAELDREIARLREEVSRPTSGRRRDRKLARLAELERERQSLLLPGELSLHYSAAGANGLNAHTLEDATIFYVTLPAERLELWFWLESDRLLAPVFRGFEEEKRIIAEERRLRIETIPGGAADAELREVFWGDSPYAWLPLGRSGGPDGLSREETRTHFTSAYAPWRLTAVLVGAVDRARVAALAERYFGRLRRGTGARSGEPAEPAAAFAARRRQRQLERRQSCDCPSAAHVYYPTVPFRHPDSYALQVLAGLLNGESGRLHRALVLDSGLAVAASGRQHPLRHAGYFLFSAETRGGARPEELVAAWDREIAALAREPIPAAELERVRSRLAADAYRRLRQPLSLARQLLIYAGLGEWRNLLDWPQRVLAVEEAEVRAAIARYLDPERRTVGLRLARPAPVPDRAP